MKLNPITAMAALLLCLVVSASAAAAPAAPITQADIDEEVTAMLLSDFERDSGGRPSTGSTIFVFVLAGFFKVDFFTMNSLGFAGTTSSFLISSGGVSITT